MTEGIGTQELVKVATAYLASVAFGLTFLVASLAGADGLTALGRGVVAVIVACVVGQLLVPPAVHSVLSAMARDEAQRRAAATKQTEDDA